MLSTTDALGRTTHFTYDALGRNVKTTYHDGSFTLTGYDTLGRRDSATDALGRRTDYEYDPQGRLTAVVLPEIDSTGSATGTANPARPRYEYAYDAYGNQVLIRDPEDDSHAGVINYTPSSGQDKETGFAYDHRGRQIGRTLPGGLTEAMVCGDTPVAVVQAGSSPENSVGGGQLGYTVDFEGKVTAYRCAVPGGAYRCAVHVPGENRRVAQPVDALVAGGVGRLRGLVFASHAGRPGLVACSSVAIDPLIERPDHL